MKKFSFSFALLFCLSFVVAVGNAQTGIISTFASGSDVSSPYGICRDKAGNIYYIAGGGGFIRKISPSGVVTTVAGTGTGVYSGDGGPATAAEIAPVWDLAVDKHFNIYMTDQYTVRKIDSAGIITTIAGEWMNDWGAGDGGPATAAVFDHAEALEVDDIGNIYVGDNYVIRKIDTAGIITHFAGAGWGDAGEGGPATAALCSGARDMVMDGSGNLYFTDQYFQKIKKIDPAGNIHTIAGIGRGVSGVGGDGGPATAAYLYLPTYLTRDGNGNIYFADDSLFTIRKINPFGIISTVAGNGTEGYSGDGGPALLAQLDGPLGVTTDSNNNVYFIETNNSVLRKLTFVPDVAADSFSVFINNLCSGVNLVTSASSGSSLTLHTYFGDGTGDTSALAGTSGTETASVTHIYATPGTYSVKEVLWNGSTAIDSAHFSYQYLLCKTVVLNFYDDANNNCIKDSGENYNYLPVVAEIDSNGVAIDTISATGGIYYGAKGSTGDVYTFKIISAPPGFIPACGGSGIVSDTLDSVTNNTIYNTIGFTCSTSSDFDLVESTAFIGGPHAATGQVFVSNNYCTPSSAVVTMTFSPKYNFSTSYPAPASVVGNVVTWNMSAVSGFTQGQYITYFLTTPTGILLTAGDTIQSTFKVTPFSDDVDTTNNVCIRVDTIRSSFDPNEMAVAPAGHILPGTTLQYTINFENTGNDTAFNIAVMDTLPDNVDVNSLRIDIASAAMNVVNYKDGGHNIVKFDFPHINLLDSSHHGQCNGMVMFHIKTKSNLGDGATLFNHAGIFFDDNPVVMTETVENIVSLIQGPSTACVGTPGMLTELALGGTWTASNASANIAADGTVMGMAAGIDTFTYSINSRYGATAVTKVLTINAAPAIYAVSGGGTVCSGNAGTDISLANSDTGFTYQLYNGTSMVGTSLAGTGAMLAMGTYTTAGTYTVAASNVSTSCTSRMAGSAEIITATSVIPMVNVTSSAADTICVGNAVTLTAAATNGGTTPSYQWQVNGVNMATGAVYTYIPADNDVVAAVLTSNAVCASPDTAVSTKTIFVRSSPIPIVSLEISPSSYISAGDIVTINATVVNPGMSPVYGWYINGGLLPGATTNTLIRSFANNDSLSYFISVGGICNYSSFNSVVFHVIPTNVLQTPDGANEIKLAPNPNKGVFTISGSISTTDEAVTVEITNMMGQVVYKKEIMARNGNIDQQIQLNKNMPGGIYLLNLRTAGSSKVIGFTLAE